MPLFPSERAGHNAGRRATPLRVRCPCARSKCSLARGTRRRSVRTATRAGTIPVAPMTVSAPPRAATIKVWAALGALSTFVVIRGLVAWVLGPDFTSSPTGTDPISDTNLLALHCFEGAVFAAGLVMVWKFLLRPLVRDRTFTFDGMLITAVLLMYFYDPLDNYFNYTFSYNAHFLNFASWARDIPGLQAPSQRYFPEPFLVMGGFYAIFMFGSAVFGCWYLRRLSARRPALTNLGLFVSLFGVVLFLDFVVENVFMRTQFAAYPGTVHSLTLFAGKYYQFPLYEPFIIATFCCGMTAIRWFRNDRGESLAERGSETLRIGGRAKKGVTFLAVTGLVHTWFIVGYFVPYNFFALKADTFPAMPSFLRAGICGQGTDYACPSGSVPIPHGTSLHLGPDDPRLPAEVRARQGLPNQP